MITRTSSLGCDQAFISGTHHFNEINEKYILLQTQQYTDDSAMARQIAVSYIRNQGFNYKVKAFLRFTVFKFLNIFCQKNLVQS